MPVLCRYKRQWNPVDGPLAFRPATIRPRQAHSRPPWPGICVLGRRCGRTRSQYALVAGSIVSFPGAPRRRVVVSFPLSTSAAESLQRSVGETFELVDIRKVDGSESIVVEVNDDVHHVDLVGPVIRALDAGAHGYLVARSVDELGDAIARAAAASERSVSSEPIALAVAPVDEIDKVLDAIIRNRARARQRQAEK